MAYSKSSYGAAPCDHGLCQPNPYAGYAALIEQHRYPDMTAQVESLLAFIEQGIETQPGGTELIEQFAGCWYPDRFAENTGRREELFGEVVRLRAVQRGPRPHGLGIERP